METYLETVKDILDNGHVKQDRTGVGTISKFGYMERYCLKNGKLPLVTTKSVHLPTLIHELLWMLTGDTDVKYLIDNGVRIWNEWTDPNTRTYDANGKLTGGTLQKIYGQQWRNLEDTRIVEAGVDLTEFQAENYNLEGALADGRKVITRHIDQIENIINQLRDDPDSRRILLSAWNVADIDQSSLPPCHLLFQFYTRELSLEERNSYMRIPNVTITHADLDDLDVPKRTLSVLMYMRSSDTFLGKPYNIGFYSLLVHALAKQLNYEADEFIIVSGDSHLYLNHLDQAKEQISRTPLEAPTVTVSECNDIRQLVYEDFTINDYEHLPHIKATVAV